MTPAPTHRVPQTTNMARQTRDDMAPNYGIDRLTGCQSVNQSIWQPVNALRGACPIGDRSFCYNPLAQESDFPFGELP